MSSHSLSLPPPSEISPSAFHEALKLYPSLVEKVYRSKLKNDAKKVADAVKRDRWRFEELPAAIAAAAGRGATTEVGLEIARAAAQASKKDKNKKKQSPPDVQDASSSGLTKDAVEKLVQWKITHGHSRPFLPAMVRKNDASAIQTQTSLAFTKLSSGDTASTATITDALDAVCKLTGIGPATGTLILNVFDPVHVPFFQDEMFLWFFNTVGADTKLKYTLKEYLALLDAVRPVLQRLNVAAVELEKVSYVLGHVDVLDPAERQTLLDASNETDDAASGKARHAPVPAAEDDDNNHANAKDTISALQEEPQPTQKGRKRVAKKEDDEGEQAHVPKRRSQRNK
ncbi:ADA HAT complex component 1 [Fonsecaea erecta]|uniref:ADA HAT complex component 1 n=1 Tax=Fonsecaea erecta TaxID=1367422 RepID=A0A178ZMP8_9EURO|nr:ADA HAT complex component 1 [Fonsecaea erecta]OAP60932.1 ADA HAT complex component 1 [Fonsecaea erecta]